MSAKLSKSAFDALSGSFNVKYLATVGPEDVPNVVPVISIIPKDETTLLFGQLMLQKTRQNLDEGRHKVGFMVIDEKLRTWSGTGDFQEFTESGPDMDRLNGLEWIRYNAYTGFRAAGRIAIRDVQSLGAINQLGVLFEQTLMPGGSVQRRALDKGIVPPEVFEKFRRLKAAKVISYVDAEGYPRCASAMAVGFPALQRMRIRIGGPGLETSLEKGAPIAASVITMDPIAYQLKAEVLSCSRNRLDARITCAYSASPPLPGEDLTAIRLAEI